MLKLSEEIKNAIKTEYDQFKDKLYAGKSIEERKSLEHFFTPPELSIEMIEEFDCVDLANKTILDPTCGSGNLLAACMIAGADSDKLFGNDYDADMVVLCRKRLQDLSIALNKLKVKDCQVHRGNALNLFCLNYFENNYEQIFDFNKIDDTTYNPFIGVKVDLW